MERVSVTKNSTQSEIKERSTTDVTVQVTVDAATVKNAIDSVYRRYSREARIPGFRPGHVPRAYLDTRFGNELFTEEAQKDLEETHLPKALSELDLRPVTTPEVESVNFDAESPFVFEARFSVLPEFELPEYRGIKLDVEPVDEVTDEEIDGTIEDIRNRFATLAPKDSQMVETGDIVHVKENDHEWDLRADADNPVTSGVIGHKIGDSVDIELAQPEGEPANVALTLLDVKAVVLPELNDAFGKDAGFDTLAALKEDVKDKIAKAKADRRERAIKVRLLDRLVNEIDLPLPETLVEEMTDEELGEFKERLAHPESPVTFEKYLEERGKNEDELKAEYREDVTQRLRRELVMGKIIDQEDISISAEELDEIARAEAEEAGEDPIRFVARLKASDRWDSYRTEKTNARVFDILYDTAKLTQPEEKK